MNQRVTKSGKRPADGRQSAPGKTASRSPEVAQDLDARLAALAAERDAALAELARAKAEIADLKATRAQVVDRIDWVIDSLKTVLEGER